MSELREEACAVGTIGGHLALLLVGEPGQGGGEVEGGLGQGNLQQEAHGTQTQGQHRTRLRSTLYPGGRAPSRAALYPKAG